MREYKTENKRMIITAWGLWSIAALFYFYEICMRMLPGIMSHDYMIHFKINATQFGSFTALYYWSYTIMQIPAGLAVDRFSIKNILFSAIATCLLGFTLVHFTDNFFIAEIGRFIIGLGSAFAYVSALKVAAVYLPPERFGIASCLLDSLGMLGALFTSTLLLQVHVHFGSASCAMLLIIFGIFLLPFVNFLPEVKSRTQRKETQKSSLRKLDITTTAHQLRNIFTKKNFWLLGFVGALSYLPSSVIGDVWGVPYLQSAYHLTQDQTSLILSLFFIAWGISGPVWGHYSDHFKSRRNPVMLSLIILLLSLAIIVYCPTLIRESYAISICFFSFTLMGIAAGAHPLIFTMAKESFSNEHAGTVVASTNMLVMMGGLIFQPLIGYFLDFNKHARHAHYYSSADYITAFSFLPVCLLLCLVAMSWYKAHTSSNKRSGNNWDFSDESEEWVLPS